MADSPESTAVEAAATNGADAIETPANASGGEGERILFFPEPCTRLAGDGCTRCQAVCPAGAVSCTEGGAPAIDDAACTRCGICIGVCDSFASSRITTVDHAKRMERRAKANGGKLFLCCEEDVFEGLEPADNVVVLRCLSSISPEFAFYLLTCGIEVALCHDDAYCPGCTAGGRFGGRLWRRSFDLAREWGGQDVATAQAIPEKEHLADRLAETDRRGLITGVADAVGEVASGQYRARKSTVLEDFMARREQMRAQLAARPREGALFLDEESREAGRRSRFARRILMQEARQNLEAASRGESEGNAEEGHIG